MANLLFAEMTRRATERGGKDNKRSGRIALGISLIAIGIAIFNFVGGNRWQAEEIALLKEVDLKFPYWLDKLLFSTHY